MQELIKNISDEIGDKAILTEADIGERYMVDWSGENPQKPTVVFRPSNTNELAVILHNCHAADQKLVVQGGMTGLSGGATPKLNEAVVSLERMSGIEEIDQESQTLTAWAGTPLQTIQDAAKAAGFYLPLDMGSRGSCTIGGNVSTNAGGNQVIRYGMTRALVLGLEAVLADGTIISSLNKMLKNNAGYDLKHLFIGTEGTIGIVTKVVLRLFPHPVSTCTALCALPTLDNVITFLKQANCEMAGTVSSFEVMWASYFEFVINNATQLRSPVDRTHPFYVLIETAGGNQAEDSERFEKILSAGMEIGLIDDAVIAQTGKERETFWNIRDGIADILPLIKPYVSFDISIPISVMKEFTTRVQAVLEEKFTGATVLIFGHLGDSNLHVVVSTGRGEDTELIYEIVFTITRDYSGSVSAEHGIGVLRKKYLGYSRSDQEVELMKKLKQSFDPKGILNHSRVFDI